MHREYLKFLYLNRFALDYTPLSKGIKLLSFTPSFRFGTCVTGIYRLYKLVTKNTKSIKNNQRIILTTPFNNLYSNHIPA